MPRTLDPDVVRRVQRIALANGGQLHTFADGSHSRTVEWDVAGSCLSPKFVELHGRSSAKPREKNVLVTSTENRPNFVQMHVRCRRCQKCLALRAYQWRNRAKSEFRVASRTWLATFTLSPTSWVLALSKARVKARKGGTDFEALSQEDQFTEIDKVIYGDLKLWFKRLRKTSKAPIRYLAITEAHKSGVPHWHILIHENGKPLRYKALKGSWPLGFDSYKLVRDAAAAGYVCKYLSKDIRARVRASVGYGEAVASLPPPHALASQPTKEEGSEGVRKR